MTVSILATKLYIRPPGSTAVLRPRLVERLQEGLRGGLMLISAPAGSGKTTLISEWVAACARLEPAWRAAWLSLDEGDNDPARFLTYLVAALQTIAPDAGTGILPLLDAPQPPPVEALLTALLNDISGIDRDFILILDDYHLVDDSPANDIITFLVEHLPPQMHLMIVSRKDPPLHLARLRARGQLTELRAADLRFTTAEAAEFLNRGMGLSLTAEHIAALEGRTEGWIAGLQLAALSLRGHRDIPEFIRAFAGDHRYIVDYLVEEVLERQPETVRDFLLQTAILDRMTGALCDAVTGQQQGSVMLEALERGNFFIVPLDDRRHWYRYHHLFADVLRLRLMSEQPQRLPVLHRRASDWYELNGSVADAIRHALAGQDFDHAAALIEQVIPAMRQRRQETTALGWLQALPADLFHRRPVLSVHYAGMLLLGGRFDGVEALLRDAEHWLSQPEALPGRVVVNKDEFRRLPGLIALYRAACALAVNNLTDTLKYARYVLETSPEDDHLARGAASAFLGLVYWTEGSLEAAEQAYIDSIARMERTGYISDAAGCALALADIKLSQGQLRQAMSIYERGLQLVAGNGAPVLRGSADMYIGMSEIALERGDLNAADDAVRKSREAGDYSGLPQNPYRRCVAMARIHQARGDFDGALNLLGEAARLYVGDFFPNVRPIAALRVRVWLAQDNLTDALDWVREQVLTIEDDLSYLREFEHITLARVLLAQNAVADATQLLERLLQSAEAGARNGRIIEIGVLLALAHAMQGDISAALLPLERALLLAEPEGCARVFVGEGAAMMLLLEKAAEQGIAPHFIRRLLKATGSAADKTPARMALIDPLSDREMDVLRLFATELSGPEIARELTVSLNTLRTHTKNIYSKLGVNNRRSAVRRAEELHLL